MIEIIVLILTSLLLFTIILGFVMSTINKQEFFGKPPIPVLWFVIAKVCAFTNIILLIIYGIHAHIPLTVKLPAITENIAFALFIAGFVFTVFTSATLKGDLIFGLPRKDNHQLQTKGVYQLSRHPFYMGFLMIMLSSVILIPNIINLICFLVAWILHHIIMIREEQFLTAKYGDEYRTYMQKTRRYF